MARPLTIEPASAMADAAAVITWQAAQASRVNAALAAALAGHEPSPQTAGATAAHHSRLWEAMRYATLTGGKRLRALLVYGAAELSGASVEVADAPAMAVELLHAYSLVHDDLPCMDDDALRRGQPACHVVFGEAMALLAGDALQTQAFLVLAQSRMPDRAAACTLLAQAAGGHGMAGGQAHDLESGAHDRRHAPHTIEALETMHRMKTGALIVASVMLGAAAGSPLTAAQRRALLHYAEALGLAFQVADDVLDVEGTTHDLGKTAGKDAMQNKTTYVSLLGLDAAKQRMRALSDEAQQALEPFGSRAWPLKTLAAQAITRSC